MKERDLGGMIENNWGNIQSDRKVMKVFFESPFDSLFTNLENEEKEAKRKQGGQMEMERGY